MQKPTHDETARVHISKLADSVLTVAGIMEKEQQMTEVQNALLVRMAEAIVTIQVRLGMTKEAYDLAGHFGLAGEILRNAIDGKGK